MSIARIFDPNPQNGFLPVFTPLHSLPENFSELQKIVDDLPNLCLETCQPDEAMIKKRVESLPNYIEAIRALSLTDDAPVIHALRRAYAFIASAYLLHPAYVVCVESGFKDYGKARTVLPKNIAQPFVAVSEQVGAYPWLDYHFDYALGNYVIDNTIPAKHDMHVKRLEMAVKFTGGQDERWFIMDHVWINQNSAAMLTAIDGMLLSAEKNNADDLLKMQRDFVASLSVINERRHDLWKGSRPEHYNDFRVYIMGIKGNEAIFGDGVIYDGVTAMNLPWEESIAFVDDQGASLPMQFRGQTGAQDDIIPTADIVTDVLRCYPDNGLTDYLMDLRKYRPASVQDFFVNLKQRVAHSKLHDLINSTAKTGLENLKALYEIFKFRYGHWSFAQHYIMKNTDYPVATGGTHIIFWLPNQIYAVLERMHQQIEAMRACDDCPSIADEVDRFDALVAERKASLSAQIDALKASFNVDDSIAIGNQHGQEQADNMAQ